MKAVKAMYEQQTEPQFTLWSRRSRCDPWREVGQAATELELTGLMSRMRSGEYIALPTGRHPDDSRKDLI